jgi:hypothetical protein
MKEIEEDKVRDLGQYTCPNLRYINRFRHCKKKFINNAELFINPITKQKLYVSEQGIFLLNCFKALNPLVSLEQIKKSDKGVIPTVLYLIIIGGYKRWSTINTSTWE